jgi:Ca2+-binding RTX toxin-like protein
MRRTTLALVMALVGAASPVRAEAPVHCKGKIADVVGTSGADTITLDRDDSSSHVVAALGGNDIVGTGAGNDVVCGGRGADSLHGYEGADRLYGTAGKDYLAGDDDDYDQDRHFGGRDTDTCMKDDTGADGSGKDADTYRSCELIQ